MSSPEVELRRAVNVLDQYRAQLDALQRQADLIQGALEENLRARETAARYREAGPGAEVLVPIGGNIFLLAEIKDSERALVGIGSDLVVEDRIPGAVERLDGRVRELREAQEAVGRQVTDLERRLEAQSEFVQGVYDRAAKRAERPDTRKG